MMLLERKNQVEREHVMAMARAYVGHVSCTRREMGSRAIPTLQLRAGWGRGAALGDVAGGSRPPVAHWRSAANAVSNVPRDQALGEPLKSRR